MFPGIPASHQVSFYTKDPDVCDGQMAEISHQYWTHIVPHLKSITVGTKLAPFPEVPSQWITVTIFFVLA